MFSHRSFIETRANRVGEAPLNDFSYARAELRFGLAMKNLQHSRGKLETIFLGPETQEKAKLFLGPAKLHFAWETEGFSGVSLEVSQIRAEQSSAERSASLGGALILALEKIQK